FSHLVASFNNRASWNGESFGRSVPEPVNTNLVSDGFFSTFGMRPVIGRDFLSAQHQLGAAPVCILAENFWRDEFHSDSGVLGKSLDLDGKSCTIVGVMP